MQNKSRKNITKKGNVGYNPLPSNFLKLKAGDKIRIEGSKLTVITPQHYANIMPNNKYV